MPTILLARHGQASYGAADYDQLSDRGQEQVELLCDELERRRLSIAYVGSGSMRRQRQTADPIAIRAGVGVETDTRLDEFDADDVLGAYSESSARQHGASLSTAEFQQVLDPALKRWIAAGADASTAESWGDFADRAIESLRLAGETLERATTGVLATSAGVIAAACVRLLGLPDVAFVPLNRVGVNAGLTKVIVGGRGLSLVSFNEHAYLEAADPPLVTYR